LKIAVKKIHTITILSVLLFIFSFAVPAFTQPAILVFYKTNGFHHACIPAGLAAIKKLGRDNGFSVDVTDDSLRFTKNNLKNYAALVFLCPTGKIFGPDQEAALKNYIEQGGGWVGIHSATDCEYNWPWYGQLAGAYFTSHPKQQEARLVIVNKNHPATSGMPDSWIRKDEWYNFKDLNPDVTVLIKIDENSYSGGENGMNHPMAWYHYFDGGRAFYTEMGHTEESWSEPVYLKHLLGGIEWAMKKS
jgi:type 1 glutamine amidotransferase